MLGLLPNGDREGIIMAEQHRWFKLWYSALTDDHLQDLPPALRWAWAALGAHTKVHGDKRGRVAISPQNAALAGAMGVTTSDLKSVILQLPNVHVEEGRNRHDHFIVTWDNWYQYQVDSTATQRQQTSRSKRREEKNREDKNKKRVKTKKNNHPLPLLLQEGAPLSLVDLNDAATWHHAAWGSAAALAYLYNETTPDECRAVQTLSPKLIAGATKFLKQYPERAWWEQVFAEIQSSPFLRGQMPSSNGYRRFKLDFAFLFSSTRGGEEHAVKIHDGGYRG
jgi:hypothetical protein